jgi:hypothetical protein
VWSWSPDFLHSDTKSGALLSVEVVKAAPEDDDCRWCSRLDECKAEPVLEAEAGFFLGAELVRL